MAVRIVRVLVLAVLACAAAHLPAYATGTKTPQPKSSVLMDAATGMMLAAKDPDAQFPPSSFAMLMTMDVAFDAVAHHKLALDTTFPISLHAWRTGGGPARVSAMFAKVKSEVSVLDLMRGVAVDVGHDAAIALAEGIAGSEPAFVKRMNARAAALGMNHTHFVNASGLPAPGQHTTARDLAVLARDLAIRSPELYKVFAEPHFEWDRIDQRNRNPLITARDGRSPYDGADGLLIGDDESHGHNIVSSALRGGRRLIAVATGLPDRRDLAPAAAALLDRGFTGFAPRQLFQAGQVVGSARMFGGTVRHVALVVPRRVTVPVPTSGQFHLSAQVVYRGPLRAPIVAGAQIATLRVWRDGLLQAEIPLDAAAGVGRGELWQRAFDATYELALAAAHLVIGQL